MSHLTTVKTMINDAGVLESAIKSVIQESQESKDIRLQHCKLEKNAPLRYWWTNIENCDFVVRQGDLDNERRSHSQDFGFVKSESGEFEFVSFDESRGVSGWFLQQIKLEYGKQKAIASLKNQNFDIEKVEVLQDGQIRILAGKW
ncbi:MAG TPA: DUF1257 domain-containing protein [Nostocaceae cyanobacterium]|nr:DUF1257 domain-containing protein [Nostocaceae cyanobacterium]